mmetsp:Transcript_9042/g.13970  ORF Transcript_9042/g.13970 Transcript_9042/m.13970 type:complete len:213 (-) Transcript_9042:1982-2620(-)
MVGSYSEDAKLEKIATPRSLIRPRQLMTNTMVVTRFSQRLVLTTGPLVVQEVQVAQVDLEGIMKVALEVQVAEVDLERIMAVVLEVQAVVDLEGIVTVVLKVQAVVEILERVKVDLERDLEQVPKRMAAASSLFISAVTRKSATTQDPAVHQQKVGISLELVGPMKFVLHNSLTLTNTISATKQLYQLISFFMSVLTRILVMTVCLGTKAGN